MLGIYKRFDELLGEGKDPQIALIQTINELSDKIELADFIEEASLLANRCLPLIPQLSYMVLNGKRYNFNFPFSHSITHEQHYFALLEYECNECGAEEWLWNPRKTDAPKLINSVCCSGALSQLFDRPFPQKITAISRYSSETAPLSRVFVDFPSEAETYYEFLFGKSNSISPRELKLIGHYEFTPDFFRYYINEHGPKLGNFPKPIHVSTYLELKES